MTKKCLIICNSLTLAQKISNILNKYGYYSSLIRTPSSIKMKSCSYSVIIRENDIENINSLLSQKNIKNYTIYTNSEEIYDLF